MQWPPLLVSDLFSEAQKPQLKPALVGEPSPPGVHFSSKLGVRFWESWWGATFDETVHHFWESLGVQFSTKRCTAASKSWHPIDWAKNRFCIEIVL
jgi:hypothetical protein